jgi:AraC family transcriptional regulator, exoenzyme S synthesis regulatory protein ExsA
MMSAIRFIITHDIVTLENQGERYSIPANSLIVTDNHARLVNKSSAVLMDFHSSSLQQLYTEVEQLLEKKNGSQFTLEKVKVVRAEEKVIDLLISLSQLSASNFLQFCYVYCLNMERDYFSDLLRQGVSGRMDFCEYIENSFLEQLSVAELAENFDLPLRKFNQLFQDTYGKPAKRWLLERRLEHARELLINTPMRIIDIALECGFSNHAHFTDTFRRHFSCNPSQVRQRKSNPGEAPQPIED